MSIPPETIAVWRSNEGAAHVYQSAMDEYVPEEFWTLLDAYEAESLALRELVELHRLANEAPAHRLLAAVPLDRVTAAWESAHAALQVQE